jgi:DNA-binding SARP family transcriptional activator
VRYQILGPVELFADGSPVRLGGPKQRAVLALLLLHANKVVPEQRFLNLVWGDDPPLSVRGQLQMYVSQLRKLIGEPVIVRRPPGYLIQIGPAELDLDIFDHTVRQARADLAEGRTDEAVDGLRSALALWRGSALGGVTQELFDQEGPVLADRRLAVLEEYFDVRLAAGRLEHLVREIGAAAAENPLRERLQAHLMLALHRSGRKAEALEVYSATRSLLVAQKGVEPGPLLRETQARLLRDEDETPPAHTQPVHTVPIPRQLPADVSVFAGRAAELTQLDALLPAENQPAPVIAIGGGAGMGKTALAVHWAHRVKDRFPDGQLYVNLRGFDPGGNQLAPEEVVRGFLEALNLPAARIPVDAEARFSLYRSLLADKRMLVVLDNARDAEQVRPLLPGALGCLTVVTSRNQVPSLIAAAGAVPVVLGLMRESEARAMLVRRLGAARIDAEPDAVARIGELCAWLPLALAIVAARAATHPSFSLAALTDELRQDRPGLDAFDAGDSNAGVRAVFSWSYLTLDAPAARLFRRLGLHPGSHVSVAAAASLLGEPVPKVRPLLAELTRAHLLTEFQPGRYGFHDLLRAYATELSREQDSEPVTHQAINRVLDHYVHTSFMTDPFLRPQLAHPFATPPPDGVTVADVRTETQAVAWFASEYESVAAAVGIAASSGFDGHAWKLACGLTSTFWHGGPRWLGGPEVYETALRSARHVGDKWALGLAHRARAIFLLTNQRSDEAEGDLLAAVRLFQEVEALDLQADTQLKLGWASGRRGDYRGEVHHVETAATLFRTTKNRHGMAQSYNNLAWSLANLGDNEQAVVLCEQALEILEEIEFRVCEAATWSTLGFANSRLGHHDEAICCYQHANELHQKVDGMFHMADSHLRIGDIHLARGATDEAHRSWKEAMELFEELRLPERAAEIRERFSYISSQSEYKALLKDHVK